MAEHDGCRIKEFARWNRVLLQHEREHISRAMAGRAFKRQEEIDGLMHDLTDLDYLLSQYPAEVEIP